MENIKIKELILEVLKNDDRLWNEDKTELNQTLLLDLIEKIDEKIIGLLLQEETLREKFFVKIKDSYVFKMNDFRFFMEENKIDNSYTAYKNRIGLTDGKKFLKDTNDVVLNWPYKDCVLEGGQSTEEGTDTYFEYDKKSKKYEKKKAKRKEIFFNQVLAHDEIDRLFDEKALINWKRYTKDGEQEVKEIKRDENGTIKENMIIKGNNLLALHSLKKQFAGKVKLIYIDPPYNTGSDSFKYNDNFNHSTWLTFMKNRLEIARELLRDDGVIFVQIDNKELHYIKVLMDEIFKRENYRNSIITRKGIKNVQKQFDTVVSLNAGFDTILFYTKNNIRIKNLFKKLSSNKKGTWNNHWRGTNRPTMRYEIFGIIPEKGQWRWSKSRSIEAIENYKLFEKYAQNKKIDLYQIEQREFDNLYIEYCLHFGLNPKEFELLRLSKNNKPEHYIPPTDENLLNENWTDILVKGNITKFEHEKNEKILKRIFSWLTKPNDIVLDYHLGSGTTAAVAHKMGRQYIGIEQMDYIETIAVERLKKVIDGEQGGISKAVNWQGGGDFIYFELAKWNEKAKEKIIECKNLDELISFFDEMYEIYFLNYNLKIKEFREKVIYEEEFKNLSLDEQKKIFIAMLDNNQMYVNKSEMEDAKFGINKKEQNLTEKFYNSEE